MAINWELARTPDFVGIARQAQDRGRERGMQQARQNAFAQYSTNPDEAVNALMGVDPEAALRLRQVRQQDQQVQARKTAAQQYGAGDMAGASNTALAAGDFDLVKTFTDMTKEQRAEEARRAQLGVSIGLSLKNVPPQAREMRLKAMLPQLTAQGLTEADIAAIPLDDEGIEAGLGFAMSASDILSKMDRDRTFGAGREDEQWKRGFSEKQFGEQVRSNRVGEGQRAQGLALQRMGMMQDLSAAGQKAQDAAGKLEQSRQAGRAKAESINETVSGVLNELGKGEAGFVGATAAKVPGTKAYNIAREIETIKANLGFQELQAMRDASPTGGALGQVAVQELVALQATVANLDIGQSEAQLRRNLEKVRNHYNKWLSAVEGTAGGGAIGPPPKRPPLTAFQK